MLFRSVDVQWAKDIHAEFSAELKLEIANQRGALASIASVISDAGANIENLSMIERDDQAVEFTFIITVRDRQHLANDGMLVFIATGSHVNLPPTAVEMTPRHTISVNGTEYSKFEPAAAGLLARIAAVHSVCGLLFGTRL